MIPHFQPGEELLHSEKAMYRKGLDMQTGFIYLTNRQLIFATDGTMMIQPVIYYMPLQDITEVSVAKNFLRLSTGITVKMRQGIEHRILTEHINEWMERIEKEKSKS